MRKLRHAATIALLDAGGIHKTGRPQRTVALRSDRLGSRLNIEIAGGRRCAGICGLFCFDRASSSPRVFFRRGLARRTSLRRRREDRRPDRPVRAGGDRDRSGFGGRRANGRGGFRRQGSGQADQVISADHQIKPDVAAGIARQWYDVDKVDLIVDVPVSAVGSRCKMSPTTARSFHHPFDRHRRFPRQVLLALCHPVGVRHACACGRHRAGSRQARRQYLVLPHRRLRFRPLA